MCGCAVEGLQCDSEVCTSSPDDLLHAIELLLTVLVRKVCVATDGEILV